MESILNWLLHDTAKNLSPKSNIIMKKLINTSILYHFKSWLYIASPNFKRWTWTAKGYNEDIAKQKHVIYGNINKILSLNLGTLAVQVFNYFQLVY